MPAPITLIDLDPLRPALADGALILTPNQRLATRIVSAWTVEQGGIVRRPPVLALEHWLTQSWRGLLQAACAISSDLTLLGAWEEQLLWQRIVGDSEAGAALMRRDLAARQLASAWSRLCEWEQSLEDGALRARFNAEADYRQVLSWMDRFELHCREHGLLPRALVPGLLLEAIDSGELPLPGAVCSYAFDELSPVHSRLLERLGARSLQPAPAQPEVQVVAAADAGQEPWLAARWARQVLEQDERARIAVVVPDLVARRAEVERVFRQVFEPGYCHPGEPRTPPPFNISAGTSLANAAVVAVALDALGLIAGELDRAALAAMIQSPFLGSEERRPELEAALIRKLWASRAETFSAPVLRREAASLAQASECEWPLATAWLRLAERVRQAKPSQPRAPSQWAALFAEWLAHLGWPGTRELDSVEYQKWGLWNRQLQAFCESDALLGTVALSTALSLWCQQLQQTPFQPQTPDSPLQILGTLEAAGLRFTHLWLLGMSERQWPAPPAPNPMLPESLQRELGLPHATAERELVWSRQLSERLLGGADSVWISYPARMDEYPARVSALFADWPQLDPESPAPDVPPLWRDIVARSTALERWQTGSAPPLPAGDARGGSALLADQSACPFRAMGHHRLRLRELESPCRGLDARERGSLLHRSLELVWSELESSAGLHGASAETLQQLVARAATQAVAEFRPRPGLAPGTRMQALESGRLESALWAWLERERQRDEFVVAALEQKLVLECGGLQLRARIDRVDRVGDRLLVIDYKSGAAAPNAWFGERPDQPQLPLYALGLDGGAAVGGIAFAVLKPGAFGLKQAGADGLPRNADAADWDGQLAHWQQVLQGLASDYRAGVATVDPKKYPGSCEWCDLAPVCRVDELYAGGEE